MNLRSKFLAWIVSLISFLVLGIGAMTIYSEARLITTEMSRHHALTIERLAKVCEESLYQSDVVLLNYFRTLEAERGFLGAAFFDSDGKIQAQAGRIGMESQSNRALMLEAPVVFAGSRVGTARLFLSRDALNDHVRRSLIKTVKRIGFILTIALIVGMLGALILTKTMVTPIEQIARGMKEVSKGRLDPIPVSDRKDELGWLGQEINVTIGKLRELDEMKKNFFSRVTHDLRSPLIGIQGLVTLLLKGQFGALAMEGKEALVDVQNFTLRLTALIDDLLTMSKLEAGRESIDVADFDIRDLIDEASRFYMPMALETKVPLILDLPTEKMPVRADRDKMMHVITNLISNAYKFTKQGSVTISARDAGNRVAVAVADTGQGIPEGERVKVFDRFYRVESAKKVKGTGLGLFIVKSLLELQKGTISVGENVGGGTKFTFTLPKPAA